MAKLSAKELKAMETAKAAKMAAILQARAESDARTADAVFADAQSLDADFLQQRWGWTLEALEREIAMAQGTVTRFAERLAKDPADAFSWGNDAVKAAATVEVLTQMLTAFRKHGPKAINYAKSRVQEMSLYPPQSTSPMSNLTEQYRLAAWAQVVRDHRRF